MEDVLIEAFHELDEDGSGRVTRDQLEVLTKKLGIDDHDRLFEALDRNRTSSSSILSHTHHSRSHTIRYWIRDLGGFVESFLLIIKR